MNQTARIISIYAADTSGVCSALYEYGGMTVIHDASGCNSTYTTHDEPRWYDNRSMVYISGFTERDAIMGNDDKFIDDLVSAARELSPRFIAICASPLPAMTGVDMAAISYQVECETGIPCFEVRTNGMQSYITGIEQAFLTMSKRFIHTPDARTNSDQLRVNVIGLTPLDYYLETADGRRTTDVMREWLESAGLCVNTMIGMDTSIEEVERLAEADVSLVVASSGRLLGKYLYDEYNIPFVTGAPFGERFSSEIISGIREVASSRRIINMAERCRVKGDEIAVVGESILSASMAAEISLATGKGVRVLESVGEGDMQHLLDIDVSCDDEDELEREISRSRVVVADPLFRPIVKGEFIDMPHTAFSGRCFKSNQMIASGTIL